MIIIIITITYVKKCSSWYFYTIYKEFYKDFYVFLNIEDCFCLFEQLFSAIT